MKGITIAYISSRKENYIEWFLDSLMRQYKDDFPMQLIVVDFWYQFPGPDFREKYAQGLLLLQYTRNNLEAKFVSPLPSPVQGKYRLTKEDWFDASLARNTAIAYAKYDYVAMVDDLSVIQPGWLDAVREHQKNNEVGLGAYMKASDMVVENGQILNFKMEAQDSRVQYAKGEVSQGYGSWFYGCNFCMPVETALQCNGWDEICAMVGTEDTQFGVRVERTGIKMVYDKRMLTIESAPHHFLEGNYFRRESFPVNYKKYCERLMEYGITDKPKRPDNTMDLPWYINDLLKYFPNTVSTFQSRYLVQNLRNKILSCGTITVDDMMFGTHFFWTDEPLSNY